MAGPFLPRRQQIAMVIEATEGTFVALSAGDVVAPILEPEWAPEFTFFERDVVQPSLSRLAQIASEQLATISFSLEMKGMGTTSGTIPNVDVALRACGFAADISTTTASATYLPVSTGFEAASIEIREGDIGSAVKTKRLIAARGTVSIEAIKGEIALFVFTFTGRYVEPLEGLPFFVNPALGQTPLPFLQTNFTFLGNSGLKVESVTLDIGNEVSIRNDANEATGNFGAVITGRSPVGSIDPEQIDLATQNFFNDLTNNTEGPLSYNLGTIGTGNAVEISAPKVQIINISEGDRDDFRIEEIDLQLNQSIAAGDDELKIVFS